MTESKAIELLEYIRETGNGEAPYVGCAQNIAIEMAINALNKQIARKPDCIEDKMWCCPVCNNHLLLKWVKYPTELMPKTEGLPHCMSCGQKIDWSE